MSRASASASVSRYCASLWATSGGSAWVWMAASWQSATPSLHLSTVVAQFAATLGVDPPTAARDATWLQRGGRQLLVDYPRHGEVSELLEMLDAATQLRTVRR